MPMNINCLEEAYRESVRKLAYASLRNVTQEKLLELLSLLENNRSHNNFPVISALYNHCLDSSVEIGATRIKLIDDTLLAEVKAQSREIDVRAYKRIISQELKYFLSIKSEDMKDLYEKRKLFDEYGAHFLNSCQYEIEDLNEAFREHATIPGELSCLLKALETEPQQMPHLQTPYLLFKAEKSTEKKRCYIIKLLTDLDYNIKTGCPGSGEDKTNGNKILDALFENGLSMNVLNKYEIHPEELRSRVHLKLLMANRIKDENEYQNEIQQDLIKKFYDNHLANAKAAIQSFHLMKGVIVNDCNQYKIETRYERGEAIKALEQFILQSGVNELNRFIVDVWLIETFKLESFEDVQSREQEFRNSNFTEIPSLSYGRNMDASKNFFDTNLITEIRKHALVKQFVKAITEDTDRTNSLNKFLERNKDHFTSYGSNLFIYEADSIATMAEYIYRKLRKSPDLDYLQSHEAVLEGFRNFKILLHIRYVAKTNTFDGIGHLGGFGKEMKRLQFHVGSQYTSKSPKDTVAYFNDLGPQFNLRLKYDKEVIEFNNKKELLDFLEEFNDIVFYDGRLVHVTNQETLKKRTAMYAANKKFNNVCSEHEKDILKRILGKETSVICEEYSTENNGAIIKAGTAGSLNASKVRYDISTVFSLQVSKEDFELLSQKRDNQNANLTEVTSIQSLSLFELIQRFGYYGEAGARIIPISEHDEYKAYAYKYVHEYFAGVIGTVTKIVDQVLLRYERNSRPSQEETNNIRLWIIGHLVAGAQNEILDGTKAKLVKQTHEMVNVTRHYNFIHKPAKHALNLKKYVCENIGSRNSEQERLDDEQLKYIQKFFGNKITENDFDKIQEIASRVYVSVMMKNLGNNFFDSGKVSSFGSLRKMHPEFLDKKMTVYSSLNYETEPVGRICTDYLIVGYSAIYPIRVILGKVLNDKALDEQLPKLISNVSIQKPDDQTYQIEIITNKNEMKNFLLELFQKNQLNIETHDDRRIIIQLESTVTETGNLFKDSLNEFIYVYNIEKRRNESINELDIKTGFINFLDTF